MNRAHVPDEGRARGATTFNMSMRKYLKQVGGDRHAHEHGDLSGRLKVQTVLTIEGHDMEHVVEGEIDLG